MTTSGPAVRVRGLVKTYGSGASARRAVDGLDLDVAHGECVAVLGPNGAGKTTTLEVLEGLRRRDAGDVSVLGSDPETAGRAHRARVGVVLQSHGDLVDLEVREVVRHLAGYYPDPRDPDEVVAMVGLEDAARTRAGRLSGGQRRRLDVACGVVGRPELLFLDEPTTGFDPEARQEAWELVRRLRAEGTTVVLTTHYLDEARALADRVVVLAAGRVVAEAPPAELGRELDLPSAVRWTEGGERRQAVTHEPSAVLRDVLARCEGEVADLEVARPSLEDVYLALLERASAVPAPRAGGPTTPTTPTTPATPATPAPTAGATR